MSSPAGSAKLTNVHLASALTPRINSLIGPNSATLTNQFPGVSRFVAANPYANPYATQGPSFRMAALLACRRVGAYVGSGLASLAGLNPYAEDPAAGYARGTAALTSAEAEWSGNAERARRLREPWRREQLANARRAADLAAYERANRSTPADEYQRSLRQDLARALNDPPYTEVLSGQALNTILDDLARVQMDQGTLRTADVGLDPEVLRHINVARGSGSGGAGVLKDGGRLTWPVALEGEGYRAERQSLCRLAPGAVEQAASGGRVDPEVLAQMRRALDRMNQTLADHIRDLPPNRYIEARRYLGSVGDAVRALGRADACDCLRARKELEGKDVADLVRFLVGRKLRFAPAAPGDEAAYRALHHALVTLSAAQS